VSLTIPQIRRTCQLADAGLSDAAVAIVLKLDFEVDLSREAVRYYRRRHGGIRRTSFESVPGLAKNNGLSVGGTA
jgi:hypothetical protein